MQPPVLRRPHDRGDSPKTIAGPDMCLECEFVGGQGGWSLFSAVANSHTRGKWTADRPRDAKIEVQCSRELPQLRQFVAARTVRSKLPTQSRACQRSCISRELTPFEIVGFDGKERRGKGEKGKAGEEEGCGACVPPSTPTCRSCIRPPRRRPSPPPPPALRA